MPTIVALRQRFESIRQSELRRLEPKLASLPPEARARVDEITRLIMEKLLINPTEQLKSASDADTVAAYSDALTRLFGLAGDDAADEHADHRRRDPHSEETRTVNTLRLGSRGSQLALFQARLVAERIQSAGGPACEIVVIKTSGDRLQEAPLSEIGGKRLFVKEIEDALLSGDIDLAVHSSKDMPAVLPDGLEVGAVLEREDPRDALVLPHRPESRRPNVQSRGRSPRIGTGSVRRIAQLRQRFPDAEFLNVRGNLDTRLRKLDAGDYDLLVLAAAGLRRLGFGARISVSVPIEECVPAPGQGIIAIEIRADDARDARGRRARERRRRLARARRRARARDGARRRLPDAHRRHRACLSAGSDLELHAVVASLDGARVIRYKKVGTRTDAAALGRDVADELLQQGAADILNEADRTNPESPIPNPCD